MAILQMIRAPQPAAAFKFPGWGRSRNPGTAPGTGYGYVFLRSDGSQVGLVCRIGRRAAAIGFHF